MKKLYIFIGIIVFFFVCKVNSQSTLLTGLEEYYKFDETSGQAIDCKGVNNSSSVDATQGIIGKINNCYSFNGTTNKITFADHANWTINQTTDLSISAWINFTGNGSSEWQNIWGFSSGPCFQFKKISDNNYQLGWYANGATMTTSTITFTPGTWYLVSMTKSGSSEFKFYLNQAQQGPFDPSDSDLDPNSVYIGGDDTNEGFYGKIDELGIWKRVLTQSEISELYNNGTGKTYPFDTDIPVTGVTVSQSSASVLTSNNLQLTATVTPTDATDKTVTWSTSNSSVATVNSSGLVTGVAVGEATITVTTYDGGFTANCALTVTPSTIPVTGVSLSPSIATVSIGSHQQLTPSISPSNATNQLVTWSTSNSSAATVNSSGLVTGVVEGTATITVTTDDGGYTATCDVTVSPSGTSLWLPGSDGIFYNDANVGIGTENTFGYKLAVNGTIGAKEVKVEVSSAWPDFVFEKKYNLWTLCELEKYIQENKHLPGIPSAKDTHQQGILVGEMNAKLLQKIEELTLYIIELKKENEEIKTRLEILENGKQ